MEPLVGLPCYLQPKVYLYLVKSAPLSYTVTQNRAHLLFKQYKGNYCSSGDVFGEAFRAGW